METKSILRGTCSWSGKMHLQIKRSSVESRRQVEKDIVSNNRRQKQQEQDIMHARLGKEANYFMRSFYSLLIVIALNRSQIGAQCPINTMTSFERIGGVTVKDLLLSVLYIAPNISSLGHNHLGADLTRQLVAGSLAGVSNLNIPITAECNNRCRRNAKCRAFLVDYERHTCFSIDHNQPIGSSQTGGLVRTPTPIYLVPTQERTSYFEKICLNLPAVECERAWIYERVMAYQINGHDDKIIDDVTSRLKCQEHCLNERDFRCRSGEYDYITMQCRLSTIDRHIKPNSFRPTTNNIDYFENQCVHVGNQCDAFDRFEDMDLGRAEIMRSANSSDQCQQFCTQTIKAFICRSFTWNSITGKCYLNSVNSFMVGGLDRLISAPGLTYYQRNDCIDLKLECDTTTMTLNLRTNEPFRGRMYVRDDPNSCETLGRSSLTSSLSIPFQSQARCATRELPSRYSSVVVVQQHPLIQRKSDRYIKVVCDFQTANKTITSSYNVVANPWTSTAFINATSFAPKIRLRITDKFGVDITGAKLGDELYLRIEAETESVYDMVARSVLAKSGTTDETIVLIDKDGCPTDYRIFPSLKKLNRRTILGKFDAFKFSSDVVVRFQVDVQFCLNQCPPTSCDQNMQLNSNAAQMMAETYNAGSLTTTISPSPATATTVGQLMPADSSRQLSAVVSSTQPPQVPFQQRTSISDINQHRTRPANFSASNSHYPTNPFGIVNSFVPGEPTIYYNSASPHSHTNHHLSVQAPANHPLASYSSGNNSILDSLAPTTSDPQIFEPSLLKNSQVTFVSSTHAAKQSSSGGQSKRRDQEQQQHISNNSIVDSLSDSESMISSSEGGGGNLNSLSDDKNQNSGRHRRRRSAVGGPMPPEPRHVPLQREIIVESSPSPRARAPTSSFDADRQRKTSQTESIRKKADKSTRNIPAYNLNGSNKLESLDQEQQVDNGTLLCTTRHSLVLASLAFCAIQLITTALCLVTWMHKRDAKFKVKHPIEERLY